MFHYLPGQTKEPTIVSLDAFCSESAPRDFAQVFVFVQAPNRYVGCTGRDADIGKFEGNVPLVARSVVVQQVHGDHGAADGL